MNSLGIQFESYPTSWRDRARTFVKELIHEDEFDVRNDHGEHHVNATPELLDYWLLTYKQMRDEGYRMPLTLQHSSSPEDRRGTVFDLARGRNKEGKEALFGLTVFRDNDAAKMALESDTSLFAPEEWTQRGKDLKYPIVHVGLTDYPEFAGLAPFEKENFMNELLEKLGITLQDGETPEDAMLRHTADLTSKVEALQAQVEELTKSNDEDKTNNSDKGNGGNGFGADVAMSIPVGAITAIKDGRAAMIDAMVGKHITPAAAKELKAMFVTDEAAKQVALGKSTDGFETTRKALALGSSGIPTNEHSSSQTPKGSAMSPLRADAQARKKRATG